jgi:hypothetical protein
MCLSMGGREREKGVQQDRDRLACYTYALHLPDVNVRDASGTCGRKVG